MHPWALGILIILEMVIREGPRPFINIINEVIMEIVY